jgi:hypothetical protein
MASKLPSMARGVKAQGKQRAASALLRTDFTVGFFLVAAMTAVAGRLSCQITSRQQWSVDGFFCGDEGAVGMRRRARGSDRVRTPSTATSGCWMRCKGRFCCDWWWTRPGRRSGSRLHDRWGTGLDASALEAMRKWRLSAGTRGETAVAVGVVVEENLNLAAGR